MTSRRLVAVRAIRSVAGFVAATSLVQCTFDAPPGPRALDVRAIQPVFAKNIQNDSGTAAIQVSRPPGSPGVSGAGVLVTLNFQAVARGNTNLTVSNAGLRNSQNQVIGGGNTGLPVRIQ